MKPIIEVENLSKLYQIGAKEAYGSTRRDNAGGENKLFYFVFILEYNYTQL